MEDDEHLEGQGFFDIGKFGVPVAIAGLVYMFLFSPLLLPGLSQNSYRCEISNLCRAFADATQAVDSQSSFLVGLEVTGASRAVGVTVDEAGLRGLDGLYLASVRYILNAESITQLSSPDGEAI